MEQPGGFATPPAAPRLLPGSPRDEVDAEGVESGGAGSSTSSSSPRGALADDQAGDSKKALLAWSPSSAATTARSPSIAATAWSARSVVAESPLRPPPPPPASFAHLDPEIASCLSRPLLDAAPGSTQTTLGTKPTGRTYWESLFIVLPMYTGYAALFGLQHQIKAAYGIQDDDPGPSYDFSKAVSCMYVWSFIARMGHSVAFGRIPPRGRVYVSMVSMLLAVLLIALVIMGLLSRRLCWVAIAYSLGGVGLGCFESNFLSCLTPLGHETKRFAILGIPSGVTLVNVGGFFLMGPPFDVSPAVIYSAVALSIVCGMLVMATRIPAVAADGPGAGRADNGLAKLVSDARSFRSWLPKMWHHTLAFTVDMFTLSAFCPGVLLYIYDGDSVALLDGLALPTSTFIAAVSSFNMVGGVMGRWLSYRVKPRHPICYGFLTVTGVLVILLWVPLLAPLGTFLVMMGDGLIYGSISRHIDSAVPRQFNLTAISFWLLMGDIGSILGSNTIYSLRCWVTGP